MFPQNKSLTSNSYLFKWQINYFKYIYILLEKLFKQCRWELSKNKEITLLVNTVKENSGCAERVFNQTLKIRGVFWGFKYVTNLKIYLIVYFLSAENYTKNAWF